MRRKLAYILLSGSLILGCAALIGPTIVSLDTDVTYGSGKDLVFKISKKGTTATGVEPSDYIINDNYTAVDNVGSEMEGRLKTWGVEADVVKEGYDTIRVKIRAQNNDDTDYRYIENFLSFSGGHISVDASLDTIADYKPVDSWTTMFDNQTARIEYVKTNNGSVPAVVVPVNQSGKNGDFANLVTFCSNNTKEADSSAGTQAQNCYLVLWNNKQAGDTYAKGTSTSDDADTNISRRLIFAEVPSEAWFTETDEDKNYTEMQIIPSSAAITSEGYNPDKAGAAYQAAFFYMNLFNCSDYAKIDETGYDVNFAFSTDVAATAEPLINAGNWSLSVNYGATFIACIVALCCLIGVLIAFYRLGSLAIISNIGVSLMGSLLLFSYFGAQFGVGALVGCLLICLLASFGGIYYFSKFKEQIYQGRSLKKAHAEAAKRSLWPTIDASIVSIILGLCVYAWVPSVVGKAGLLLVLGGFFSGVFNCLLLRIETWFLANDDSVEKNYVRIYNIDESKVPNLAKEEKPTYFGPYANTNFAKHSKLIGIISAVIAVASIAGISTFMSINKGQAYNFASTYDDTTVSYIEYRVDSASVLPVNDEADLEDKVIALIQEDGKEISYSNVTLENGTVYLSNDEKSLTVHYYTINWTKYYDPDASYNFTVKLSTGTESYATLEDALTSATNEILLSSETSVSVQNVKGQIGQPSIGYVWLGFGVGTTLCAIYLMIRYKLSRGLSSGILALSAGLITMGFFSLTRIATTPVVSLAVIAASYFVLLGSIFFYGKAKELSRDSREKDKESVAFRALCLTTANKQAAGDFVIFAFLAAFSGICFLGFAPSVWFTVFVGIIVALVVAIIFSLTLLAPLANLLSSLLSKIHLSFHFKKKETPTETRKRGSEPEEAVFIGIND